MKRLLTLLSVFCIAYIATIAFLNFAFNKPEVLTIPVVRSFYLSKFNVAEIDSPSVPCGFTADRLRIRALATTSSEVLDVLPANTNICFTETIEVDGSQWGRLEDSKDYPIGWVFMNFVNMDPKYSMVRYSLVDIDPSKDCWFDEHVIEVVSPHLISINRGYTNFTLEELEKLDVVVSETMVVDLIPAFIWWIKFPEIPLTRPFTRDHEENWEGFQTNWSWDGCNLVPILSDVIALTVVVTEYGESNALGTYLHERAHSLHAVHGRAGLKTGVKLDADVEGPNDAYWWSDIGKAASMGTCRLYEVDTLDYTTCTAISNIVN